MAVTAVTQAKPATKSKRYNLVLPEDLYKRVQTEAKIERKSVLELFRWFTELGLLMLDIKRNPGKKLILREGDTEREILLI